MKRLSKIILISAMITGMVVGPQAGAVHFYRSTASGCSAATGGLTDDEPDTTGPLGATVMLGHNTYIDSSNATPVTKIAAGESVTWTWNSAHCHSISSSSFQSGFHYPEAAPDSPRVHSAFEYPLLEMNPTLSYTHTFDTPGTYVYSCVHHGLIGMVGTIEVE